jgi:type I restriction enzyme S subunit
VEKIRFKYAVELIMGQSPEKESINYGGNGFPFLQGKADFGTISPTPTTWCDSPKKIAKKGDILLSVRAPVGDVNISNQEYAIGRGLCAIRAKKIDGRYCWYILQEINDTLHSFAVGTTYESVTVDDIANLTVPYPDGLVQKEIARYLDSKIGKIDELIENQEKQHNMLEQYKRELIANTITKGLNKSAPMKGSGVDWLGNVPEHWNVTKMKWMFEVVKRIYGAEDRDVLSITQRGIKVKDIDSNDGQLAESYANYQVVNVNDFAMNSMDLLTGWVDCSPYEGVTSPDYRVFRFHHDKPQCHTYYKYLFQMCYTNRIFYRLGQGVSNLGRWRLQADQFLNMKMPQPPIEEQEQIASYLDKKVGQIEELTADIKAQIEKLKEYRKIVIHDAVTEKIKVTEGE